MLNEKFDFKFWEIWFNFIEWFIFKVKNMANLDYGINNKQQKIIKLQRRVSIIMIVYISKIIWIFERYILLI